MWQQKNTKPIFACNRITTRTPLYSSFFIPHIFLRLFETHLSFHSPTLSNSQTTSLPFLPSFLPFLLVISSFLLTLTHFYLCQHVSCHLLRADTKSEVEKRTGALTHDESHPIMQQKSTSGSRSVASWLYFYAVLSVLVVWSTEHHVANLRYSQSHLASCCEPGAHHVKTFNDSKIDNWRSHDRAYECPQQGSGHSKT